MKLFFDVLTIFAPKTPHYCFPYVPPCCFPSFLHVVGLVLVIVIVVGVVVVHILRHFPHILSESLNPARRYARSDPPPPCGSRRAGRGLQHLNPSTFFPDLVFLCSCLVLFPLQKVPPGPRFPSGRPPFGRHRDFLVFFFLSGRLPRAIRFFFAIFLIFSLILGGFWFSKWSRNRSQMC